MIYFATRAKLRAFGSTNGVKKDFGADALPGKRYAFILNKG